MGRQHVPAADAREGLWVAAVADELAVEHQPGGQSGEFGYQILHAPAAAGADAQAVDGRNERAKPVRLQLVQVIAAGD